MTGRIPQNDTRISKQDYTPGFSLQQSRLCESGVFFSICKTISRFYRGMVLYNTPHTAVLTVGAFYQPSGEL